MAKRELSEAQNAALEFIWQGYAAGAIGANGAMGLMKDAGLTQAERVSWLETFAIKKGMDAIGKANA